MSSLRAALTDADVHTLVKGVDADDRAAAAHKICRRMEREELSDEDRRAAQDILRVMAADAAELVRRALAVTLKSSPLLPRDVANKLARDVESVAIPVLNYSPVFTDEDLVALLENAEAVRQIAVASRASLSERVTSAIVEGGVPAAIRTACANDNARFTDRALETVISRYGQEEGVHEAVSHRRTLPLAIAEKLVALSSEAVRDHLVNHHALTPDTALSIALGARDRATYDLVEQAARAKDLSSFCQHLNRQKRLSPSLLLRALASGHMPFFEHAVAELAGVPHARTWLMIHDAGPLGLRAIYERAGLPARLYPAFRTGVDTWRAMDLDGGPRDRERFQERMLQRFLTQGLPAGREDVDYLLDKMDRLAADPAPRLKRRGAA